MNPFGHERCFAEIARLTIERDELQYKCNNFADKCHAANKTNAVLRDILAKWLSFASDVVPACAAFCAGPVE